MVEVAVRQENVCLGVRRVLLDPVDDLLCVGGWVDDERVCAKVHEVAVRLEWPKDAPSERGRTSETRR